MFSGFPKLFLCVTLFLSLLSCHSGPELAFRPPDQYAPSLQLPAKLDSLKFAVIGDSGTGGRRQREVANRMEELRNVFSFGFVLMQGDNLYGRERPKDYFQKFQRPYQALLQSDVKFYAVLGNHDNPKQRFYGNFNMGGERYYTFAEGDVRFYALDTTEMTRKQLSWLEKELKESTEEWKICFFHHPIYSSGKRHGASLEMRAALEPLFVKYGVSAAFSGHEHFYERIRPQNGIHYFISGAAGKLRRGNVKKSQLTARAFDQDNSFMLVEITGEQMHFQTISRTGETVDYGVIRRRSQRAGLN
jgi:predicted phosphodiesterase